jgi:uncharacterized protein (DUF885 family)
MKRSLVVCLTTWTLLWAACNDDGGGECIAPEPAPETSVDEVLASLDGLSFDDFLDASYEAILRRSPEGVSSRGLSEALGMRNDALDDVSDEYALRTMDLIEGIQTRLRSYDRAALGPAQQLSRDTYDWYLGDRLRWREFLYYDYTILVGTYGQLYYTLVTAHPIEDRSDAEDYLNRLRQVSGQLDQVRDKLAVRAQQGIIAPRILLADAANQAESVALSAPRDLPLYTSFENQLWALPGLSAAEQAELLAAAEDAIACHVIPAFDALSEDMRRLLARAPEGHGAEQYEGGADFYAAELAHHSTTDMTPTEVHELGLAVLPGLHAAMRAHFATLGYPEGEPLPQLYERLAADTGLVFGDEAVAGYEALIAGAESRLGDAFVERPGSELVVIGVDSGDYYIEPALDGSRPGAFYATVSGIPRYGMPTLAYHEAIPGHHMQISFAQTLALPDFRRDVGFTAYAEGWGLYAEELAAELGWYEGDIPGDLGRLQDAAMRAARLVVDTGIHAFGWSFDEAVAFMVDNVGYPASYMESQVYRYISWPGQATAYWLGKQRILDLRQEAVDALGPAYDRKAFHTAVLSSGSVPLDVLSTAIQSYIDAAGQPPTTLARVEAGSRTAWLPATASTMPRRDRVDRSRARPAMSDLLDCASGALPGCGQVPLLRDDAVPARIP